MLGEWLQGITPPGRMEHRSVLVLLDQIAFGIEDKVVATNLPVRDDLARTTIVGEEALVDIFTDDLAYLGSDPIHHLPRNRHWKPPFRKGKERMERCAPTSQ